METNLAIIEENQWMEGQRQITQHSKAESMQLQNTESYDNNISHQEIGIKTTLSQAMQTLQRMNSFYDTKVNGLGERMKNGAIEISNIIKRSMVTIEFRIDYLESATVQMLLQLGENMMTADIDAREKWNHLTLMITYLHQYGQRLDEENVLLQTSLAKRCNDMANQINISGDKITQSIKFLY